jgi:hypothetical protein
MRKRTVSNVWVIVVSITGLLLGLGKAGEILFDSPTDSIGILGNTVLDSTCTFEAWVMFTPEHNGGGFVFNEWTDYAEDKALAVDPRIPSVSGYTYPPVGNDWLTGYPGYSLVDGSWHHIAYVRNGNADHVYLDGSRIATRVISGSSIGNSSIGFMRSGAIYRDRIVKYSFVGYLDSLRISNSARYTAPNYMVPDRDMPLDANTLILFWFNEQICESNAFEEISGNRIGFLGADFGFGILPGATSPTFMNPCQEPYCTKAIDGDLNHDCKVDLLDFSLLAGKWLECNLDPPDACWD